MGNIFSKAYSEIKRANEYIRAYNTYTEAMETLYFDRHSKFNDLGLKWVDGKVNAIVNIPDNFQLSGTEWQISDKLSELTFSMTQYLTEELNYGEYVQIPHYYHIEDPRDDVHDSCTYLAVWDFAVPPTYKNLNIVSFIIVALLFVCCVTVCTIFPTLYVLIPSILLYLSAIWFVFSNIRHLRETFKEISDNID